MTVLGLTRKLLGPGLRAAAMVLGPVAAVLAWGAVENERDRRRTRTVTVRAGEDPNMTADATA